MKSNRILIKFEYKWILLPEDVSAEFVVDLLQRGIQVDWDYHGGKWVRSEGNESDAELKFVNPDLLSDYYACKTCKETAVPKSGQVCMACSPDQGEPLDKPNPDLPNQVPF